MATHNATDRTAFADNLLFASVPNQGFRTYEFDYAAPAGNEDANINRLIIGDWVYTTGSGRVKKLKETTSLTSSIVIGLCTGIQDIDGNIIDYVGDKSLAAANGKLFDADGGLIKVYTGNHIEFPIYAINTYIHKENSTGADTRIPFDWATHGATGVLAGRVRLVNELSTNPTIIIV